MEQQVTRHSKQLLDLAKQSNWSALRRELIATQKEVESTMLDLHDEANGSFAQFRWLVQGLEIGTTSVIADFLPDRSAKLRQFDFLDY